MPPLLFAYWEALLYQILGGHYDITEVTINRFLRLNPIALRMAKTLWSFGHSQCNRVKMYGNATILFLPFFFKRDNFCDTLSACLDDKSLFKQSQLTLKEFLPL